MPKLSKSEIDTLIAWFAVVSIVLTSDAVDICADEGLSTDVLLLLFEQGGDSAAAMQTRLMKDFAFDYISALRISNGVARRCGVQRLSGATAGGGAGGAGGAWASG